MFPVRLILQKQGMCIRGINDLFSSSQGIANSRDLKYGLTQDSRPIIQAIMINPLTAFYRLLTI